MNKMTLVGLAFAVCFFTGCSAKPTNTNINKGMELLEQMDYSGAMESFEAALVYKEDEQLIYRGEGLANWFTGRWHNYPRSRELQSILRI